MLLSSAGKVLNRVILERKKNELDKRLRDEQAGFRKDRSCTDNIATLRIIEQSLECNSYLYLPSIHYKKTFDSSRRPMTIPLASAFVDILPGVRKGLLLSAMLFLDNEINSCGRKAWNSVDVNDPSGGAGR